MAKFELELDDKGEFVGSLAPEVSAVLDRIKSTAHGEGFGKGNQKAAAEAKAQIDSAIAAERAKWDAALPIERAKWADIESMNTHLKTQLDAQTQQTRKAQLEREEAHAAEITRRVDRENKRDTAIRALVNQNLRALASSVGARDESLGELEVILQHRIGYDDDMQAYVKAEDGSRAKTTAGNDLPIDVFVKQYLDNHPHHRKAPAGKPGNAAGGASYHGHTTTVTVDAAKTRIDSGDRSPDAINDLFAATRRKTA
jgi:hypothetical protein